MYMYMYMDQNCMLINFKMGISSSHSMQKLHSIAETNIPNENNNYDSLSSTPFNSSKEKNSRRNC